MAVILLGALLFVGGVLYRRVRRSGAGSSAIRRRIV
jgi:hypothetical protein